MAIFEKDGKKSYHMNPQMGKSLHGSSAKPKGKEEGGKEIGAHFANHLEHHAEVHHGGHPDGQPPMHDGHTHHTILHRGGGHGGGGIMGHPIEDGERPEINNHESYEEAEQAMRHHMNPEAESEETGEDELVGHGAELDEQY